MSRMSRYRLISGSESITNASTPTMTAAKTSLLSIPSTSFPPLGRHYFSRENLLDRPHRVRQGLKDRPGQAHPGADVGRLARHQQAVPGAPAERAEQREDAVRGQAVRVDDRA